jgi:putative addiction module component (TIGR02574 family)
MTSEAAMSDLRNEIGNLSAVEKFELLDALWESLEADEVTLTDAQRDELDHRIGQYARNPDEVVPWEQVRAGLFKKQ